MCGKRGNQAHRPPSVGDHPRARRGAQQRRKVHAWQAGIIPVCTGSTSSFLPRWSRRSDHPRMHGEHNRRGDPMITAEGSSPYARGARYLHIIWKRPTGIIPVCTGSTATQAGHGASSPDHPRMHGEHFGGGRWAICFGGSSPYARGAPHVSVCLPSRDGIIPVCTGSTWLEGTATTKTRDHPRMHGEHINSVFEGFSIMGSSPYARGAPHQCAAEAGQVRIIPVCTGSTRFRAP